VIRRPRRPGAYLEGRRRPTGQCRRAWHVPCRRAAVGFHSRPAQDATPSASAPARATSSTRWGWLGRGEDKGVVAGQAATAGGVIGRVDRRPRGPTNREENRPEIGLANGVPRGATPPADDGSSEVAQAGAHGRGRRATRIAMPGRGRGSIIGFYSSMALRVVARGMSARWQHTRFPATRCGTADNVRPL
jgi:hypothetical protein